MQSLVQQAIERIERDGSGAAIRLALVAHDLAPHVGDAARAVFAARDYLLSSVIDDTGLGLVDDAYEELESSRGSVGQQGDEIAAAYDGMTKAVGMLCEESAR